MWGIVCMKLFVDIRLFNSLYGCPLIVAVGQPTTFEMQEQRDEGTSYM